MNIINGNILKYNNKLAYLCLWLFIFLSVKKIIQNKKCSKYFMVMWIVTQTYYIKNIWQNSAYFAIFYKYYYTKLPSSIHVYFYYKKKLSNLISFKAFSIKFTFKL